MALPILVLPGQWEINERHYKIGDAATLGEGYKQSYKDLKERRTWDVSTVGMAHRIKAVHEQLLSFQGDKGFLWSPDGGPDKGGMIALAAYRCRSWELKHEAPGVMSLSGLFESTTGGECEAYKPLIDVAKLAPVLTQAIGWLATASPLSLGAHCRSATAAKLIAVLARASQSPALSDAARGIAKAESLRLASTAMGRWFGGPPPALSADRLWAPHAAIANEAQWSIGPVGAVPSVSGVHGHIVQCEYNGFLLPTDAVTIANWVVETTAANWAEAPGRHWLQSTQVGSPMPAPHMGTPWDQKEVDQPGRYPVLYLVRVKAGAIGELERIDPLGNVGPAAPGDIPGYVRIETWGYWGPLIVSYGAAIGPALVPGQPMSLRPSPRAAAPSERGLDPSAVWAWCDAWRELKAIDGGGSVAGWTMAMQTAIEACEETALALCQYRGDNSPVFWKRDAAIGALGWPGTGHRSVDADGAETRAAHERLTNGLMLSTLAASPNNPHAAWWNTTIEGRFGDSNGAMSKVKLELAASKLVVVNVEISTSPSPVKTGKYNEETDYSCPLVLTPQNDIRTLRNSSIPMFEVGRRNLIKWGKDTVWHWQKYQTSWRFDPYWGVTWPGSGGTVSVNPTLSEIDGVMRLVAVIELSQTGSYSGVDLKLLNKDNASVLMLDPPEFCYSMVNLDGDGNPITGGQSARVACRNYARLHKFELPPTNGAWVRKKFAWADRLQGNGGNDNRTDWGISFDPDDGWKDFRVETNPGAGHRCKIQIWWIGAPPIELPAEHQFYRLTIGCDEHSAYALGIGTVKGAIVGASASGPPRPGVGIAPHGASLAIGNPSATAIVSARAGALYPADQNPAALYELGPAHWEQARSQLALIDSAQTAYSKQVPGTLGGPLAPALRVAWHPEPCLPPLSPYGPGTQDNPNATINSYGDRGNGGGYDQWGWAGYEPAPGLSDALLSYKAIANAAQVWGLADRLGLPAADRALAKSVALTGLRWIDALRNQQGALTIPSRLRQGVAPSDPIDDAQSIAYLLQAAVWANLAGDSAEAGLTYRLCVALQGALLALHEQSAGQTVPWASPGTTAPLQDQVAGVVEAVGALLLLAEAKPNLSVPACSVPMGPR